MLQVQDTLNSVDAEPDPDGRILLTMLTKHQHFRPGVLFCAVWKTGRAAVRRTGRLSEVQSRERLVAAWLPGGRQCTTASLHEGLLGLTKCPQ